LDLTGAAVLEDLDCNPLSPSRAFCFSSTETFVGWDDWADLGAEVGTHRDTHSRHWIHVGTVAVWGGHGSHHPGAGVWWLVRRQLELDKWQRRLLLDSVSVYQIWRQRIWQGSGATDELVWTLNLDNRIVRSQHILRVNMMPKSFAPHNRARVGAWDTSPALVCSGFESGTVSPYSSSWWCFPQRSPHFSSMSEH
jgi:hypothetical protein